MYVRVVVGPKGNVGWKLQDGDITAGLAAHALVVRQGAVTLQHIHTTEHGAVSMTTLACEGENREMRLGRGSRGSTVWKSVHMITEVHLCWLKRV